MSKQELYGRVVRALLADQIRSVKDRSIGGLSPRKTA
jgi:hypothetical protein